MSEIKFCPQCGAPVQEGAKFCVSCGCKLEGNISSSQPTTPEDIPTEADTDTTTYEVASAKHKAAYTKPSMAQKIDKEHADVSPANEHQTACPVCGQQISQEATMCPYCHVRIVQNTQNAKNAPVATPAATLPKSRQNEMPTKDVSDGKTKRQIWPFLLVVLLAVAVIWGIYMMLHSEKSPAEAMRESVQSHTEEKTQTKTQEKTPKKTSKSTTLSDGDKVVMASELEGTIGDSYDITMKLTSKEVKMDDKSITYDISGTYYYDRKGENNKLRLRGNGLKDGTMVLYEFDSNGESTGKFEGKDIYEESKGAQILVFKGTFTTKAGKSMPFKLYYVYD